MVKSFFRNCVEICKYLVAPISGELAEIHNVQSPRRLLKLISILRKEVKKSFNYSHIEKPSARLLKNRLQRRKLFNPLLHRHNDDANHIERDSYGGGGGGGSYGCCDSTSRLRNILKALLLAILLPLALLLVITLLSLLTAALQTYISCLLGNNVTIKGVTYNCTGLSQLFNGISAIRYGSFLGFNGVSVITVIGQQQQQQVGLYSHIPNSFKYSLVEPSATNMCALIQFN